jgi:hypothetical protein
MDAVKTHSLDSRDETRAGDQADEWSVVLDGRYVVTFRGPHAEEFATRQLHELAGLLGFYEEEGPLRPDRGRPDDS